jgi:Family of unknown function (DUF5678)
METNNYEQIREQAIYLPFEAQQTLRSALALSAAEQQQLLRELMNHRTVRVRRGAARDYSAEQEWLRENRRLYRGQYLAVSGGQLLAHGTDPKAVLAAARATGRKFLLSRAPQEDEVYGGGLW